MTDEIDAKETEEIEGAPTAETDDTEDTIVMGQPIGENDQLNVTVTVMTEEEFYTNILQSLQNEAEQFTSVKELYRALQKVYFGPHTSQKEAQNAPITDERQQKLLKTYFMRTVLDPIKNDAITLNPQMINSAFSRMFNAVGLGNIPVSAVKPEYYDQMFNFRTALLPLLQKEYEILQINRDVAEIYSANKDTIELSDKVIKMEDYFSQNYVNREQLAKFYYNIGAIYDAHSSRRNTKDTIDDELDFSMVYKYKALKKTSDNIALILDIRRDWKPRNDYKPEKILDACHRVIDNSGDARSLYRAHMLYAETLFDFKGTDGFSDKREKRIASAIKHYRKALNYTDNVDEKVDILNTISDYQKRSDAAAFIRTRLELISLLSYRERIREYNRLVDEVDDVKLKKFMFKAAINEYYELEGIDKEDRQLYDELDTKFRDILGNSAKDRKIIETLDSLKKVYGSPKTKTGELISQASTNGYDFFDARRIFIKEQKCTRK